MIQVTSAPYVMQEVTKVMLGAHAVLANGGVMARVGASQVILSQFSHIRKICYDVSMTYF